MHLASVKDGGRFTVYLYIKSFPFVDFLVISLFVSFFFFYLFIFLILFILLSFLFFQVKCPSSTTPSTDVELSLARLHLYLDVTIIDRFHALLHPQPTRSSHSQSTIGATSNTLYYPSVNTSIHGNQVRFQLMNRAL